VLLARRGAYWRLYEAQARQEKAERLAKTEAARVEAARVEAPAIDAWHGFNERFEWGRLRVRNDTTLAELAQITDLQGTTHGKRPEDQ